MSHHNKKRFRLDQNKNIFDIYFLVPRFNIWGMYDLKGEIINVQINGQGIANTTFCMYPFEPITIHKNIFFCFL